VLSKKKNLKKNTKSRSLPFQTARKQDSLASAEDYTELVAELIVENGEARICDIASSLGISHVTAIRTVNRLQKEGFLKTSPRKPVVLTKKGQKLAEHCAGRHQMLVEFFVKLGVPKGTAETDVEGMEHHISKVTLSVIKKKLGNL
jgi:DtxR family manganese transport transcriptional regulator